MCSGGGGSPATIVVPNYNAYNSQFDLQKSAIEQAMSSGIQQKQLELNSSLQSKGEAQARLVEQAKLQAENTNAQAMRLASLIGPPPPEKTAEAPLVGASARRLKTTKGKGALRIERSTATSTGQGAGLNIT